MSEFPEEKHMREVHRCPEDGIIALLDYPAEWDSNGSTKAATVMSVKIDTTEPKAGVFATVDYYDQGHARPTADRTVFPIDQDRGIRVAPRDAEEIVKDCADEVFFVLLSEASESLKSGGVLKIALPDDKELLAAFELAKQARTSPNYRSKVEFTIDDKLTIVGNVDNAKPLNSDS